jgi:uncharacterized protein (DUF433 family)
MVAVTIDHVYLDDDEVARIRNTTTKVIEIVLDHTEYGLSAAEIHAEHPHLSLAQIHAALSYYFDHKTDIDREIGRRYEDVERFRREAGDQLSLSELQRRRDEAHAVLGG